MALTLNIAPYAVYHTATNIMVHYGSWYIIMVQTLMVHYGTLNIMDPVLQHHPPSQQCQCQYGIVGLVGGAVGHGSKAQLESQCYAC